MFALIAGEELIFSFSGSGTVSACPRHYFRPVPSINSLAIHRNLPDKAVKETIDRSIYKKAGNRTSPASGGQREVEPPPAGAGGSHEQRDLPGLLTRDYSLLPVARKRFPPPAGAGGCQGAGLQVHAHTGINRLLPLLPDPGTALFRFQGRVRRRSPGSSGFHGRPVPRREAPGTSSSHREAF